MRIRPLIVAGLLEAYGLWRFMMDVFGDADILRTLSDPKSWLHIYGPALAGVALAVWAFGPFQRKRPMSDGQEPHLFGINVENSGGGTGMEILGGGEPGSIAHEISLTPQPGQGATGLRVVQSGPGTGMRIVQSGPGTGLKISVGVPKDPTN